MANSAPNKPKQGQGLSVNDLQGWAHHNVGHIWLTVVIILATISAIVWSYNVSLIFFGVGLLLGTLAPTRVRGLLFKGFGALSEIKGTAKLVTLVIAGALLIVFPFLLTLLVAAEGGAHLVVEHKILDFLSRFRD
jgi:hypothetical protein